jgi:hypothetical protein
MSACASLSQPSAQPTATQPILDDLAVYKMLTDKYTAYYVILGINDMPVDEAARILQALKGIEPPAGLEELHQQAIRAYEYVCAGKLLLPGSDSQLRAEAYFEIDWGVKLLFDYREQLDNVAQPTGRSVQ